jgi:hypothetical protein
MFILLLFPLVGIVQTPLWKRGVRGDFMEDRFIQKIPLNPPLPKGEDIKKDSGQARLRRTSQNDIFQTNTISSTSEGS